MIIAIAKRELTGLFFSPIAYVVLGAFAIGASTFFLQGFEPGQPASMRSTFDAVVWLLVFLAPAISMRLISEELRSGTFERLMTSPVSDTQVVLGKWLGALVFFCVMLLPLVIHAITLEFFGSPEFGPIATGLLGLIFVGALYLAIGVFASAWSQNQIIAFLVTVFIIALPTFAAYYVSGQTTPDPATRRLMDYLSVNQQYADFAKGLIDIRNFVYFSTGTALFLFLSVVLVQSRRWR
ncbi:MAG: ABC transporter permease [Phycisphaeraceae bacterium]|nr:ABC transporter permease [Phycisphaeraceae bacterium]